MLNKGSSCFFPNRFANFNEYSLFFLLKLFSISSVFEGTGETWSSQFVYQGFSLKTILVELSYIERVNKVG